MAKQDTSYPLVCFPQKICKKNVPITNNDTEHTRKMKFPQYNCFPAIAKLIVGLHALHASKSRVNVAVELKVRNLDVSYL